MPETPAAESTDSPAPKSEGPSKGRTLLNRSASTICLVGLLVLALWFAERWIFLVLFSLLSFGALVEYFRIFPEPGFRRFRWQTFLVAGIYLALLFSPLWGFEAAWLGELDGIALALLTLIIVAARLRSPLEGFRSFDEIAATLFGFIYCFVLFGFIPKLLLLPLTTSTGEPSAVLYVFYLVAVTKFTYMGAYLVGSAIGKDKLVPHISLGKTLQGLWGGIFFALAGSYAFYFIAGDSIPIITAFHAGFLGLIISIVAVLGDLVESIMKRCLAVKDSGHVMPGIGGILDLVDSVILSAPVYYFYLLLVG